MKTQNILITLIAGSTVLLNACASSKASILPSTSPQIYEFESGPEGFNTKNYFYDNGFEVVAFDSQFTPELARKSIEFLRTKSKNPIRYLIITHPNPDKFKGMSEFKKEGALVVSSQETQQALIKPLKTSSN